MARVAAVVLVVLAVGAPFVYIHLIEGPHHPKLSLPTTHSKTTAADSGHQLFEPQYRRTYNVGSGIGGRVRVTEVLIGQNSTAVRPDHQDLGIDHDLGASVTSGIVHC